MAQIPGFQKSATANVAMFYPGDVIGGQTTVTLSENGYLAADDCLIGNGLFRSTDGVSVSNSSVVAGTTVVAGINVRNAGGAYMSWTDSQLGFSLSTPAGSQPTAWIGGKMGALVTGVNTSGAANHTPLIGELLWMNNTTGALACAPASVATVTGYTKVDGVKVQTIGGVNENVTIGANQGLVVIAGQILGA